MIDARDRSGRVLSVFHNRRWDWDFERFKTSWKKDGSESRFC
ncbi:MAG: hypothetical protein U0835_20975 [Isosphaeraceae bacterium]